MYTLLLLLFVNDALRFALHVLDIPLICIRILFANLDTFFYEMKFSGVMVDLALLGILSIPESCYLNWLKDLGMKKCAISQPVVHTQLLSPNLVRYLLSKMFLFFFYFFEQQFNFFRSFDKSTSEDC